MIDALPLLLGPEGYQISRSVRLRSAATAFFSKAAVGTSTNALWTYSIWVKRGSLGTNMELLSAASGSTNYSAFFFNSTDTLVYQERSGATTYTQVITTQVFRDPSAWYHIVLAYDSANATAANRVRIFVNGAQVTNFSTATYPSTIQNSYISWTGSTLGDFIGRFAGSAVEYLDGYITEVNFVTGQALTPSSFGETDILTGVWKPKKYVGTYGTNGFYLNFSDPSAATAAAIGKDYSGNGNNWTPNNISVTAGVTYDSMLDVPTPWADGGNGRGNYCTLNPLDNSQNAATGTLSNGNLTRTDSTATNTATFGTMFVSSGQWYYEVLVQAISSTTANCFVALSTNGKSVYVALRPDGSVLNCTKSGSGTYTTNDVLGVAVDIGANSVSVYKNGTLIYTLTPTTALTDFTPSIADGTTLTGAVTASFNFGQQPFSYTPPTGYKALNTQNLPTPTIAKGNQYFDVNLWAGTSASNSIVNAGAFAPDFVWIKDRTTASSHQLYDALRGTTKALFSDSTVAETTVATGLTAFNSNGFTVVSDSGVNQSGRNYVGWQWKEGATQGFDIVTYTGTGVARTVAHSLGVAPAMMIVKLRSGSASTLWLTYHQAVSATPQNDYLQLQATAARASALSVWNNTAPTSSVFTVGTDTSSNGNGSTYVAYLFAEVAGFSRFGSYTGNGSADGPFVFCGFRPRWIMVKNASALSDWYIIDTARDPANAPTLALYADTSGAEVSSTWWDITSNGFKLRNSAASINGSGNTLIFAAFAENPFKYSLAR